MANTIRVYRGATRTWPWRWRCDQHHQLRVFRTHEQATGDAHLHAARHHR